MRRFSKAAILGCVVLGVGARGVRSQMLGQEGETIRARRAPGGGPANRSAELAAGYPGLTLGEFPAFQTYRYEGRSGAFAMAWRTQRHLRERAGNDGVPGWARGISSGQGLGYYLGEEKWKLLASLRKDETHAPSPRSFESVPRLEEEIFRRLEGKEIRKLVFILDSSAGLRRRYLVVFRARDTEDRGEPGRVYDFYDPHAATDEDEVAGSLEAPIDQLSPGLRGGRFGQLRVLPGSGGFQVSASWAASADAGAAVGMSGDDRFARPIPDDAAWCEVGIEQFGVADKGRLWGLWGGGDTPYSATRGEDLAREGWGAEIGEFRRSGVKEETGGYRFGTFDQVD